MDKSANIITLVNIIFGSLALIQTMERNYTLAAIFIFCAVFMDGLDGRVARKFGVMSDIGKQLDSLCDLVSFGVAPALLIYAQLLYDLPLWLGVAAALIYIMCGAFRLARFNVLNISDYFIGLPITMAGLLMALLSLLAAGINSYLALLLVLLLAFLMVSNFRIPKI
ncbi:MAG: CDP-diacylglycerol--serine O-phosphatidyltransferase [Syntrophomonadaceae bacterium]|nr:CDP-diacylglycerol--serine O-phosphatidyltransferase [Syntrophomonadaceae bacterium]